MENQPFRVVQLKGGLTKIINEAQVVSVEKQDSDGQAYAYIRMSNGDNFLVENPPYEDWENDCHSRKY